MIDPSKLEYTTLRVYTLYTFLSGKYNGELLLNIRLRIIALLMSVIIMKEDLSVLSFQYNGKVETQSNTVLYHTILSSS